MNTILILLLVRIIVPISILLGIGELIKHRETNNWSKR